MPAQSLVHGDADPANHGEANPGHDVKNVNHKRAPPKDLATLTAGGLVPATFF